LNKQYTKEEYEELVPRLIEHMERGGEWGQFYPPSLSPYGFNESVAHEYLPLPESEARKQGFLWREMQEKKLDVSKTIQAGDLPDSISDIPDDVLNWAIVCNVTSRPFRIVRQELEFYRRNGIPVPRVHPDERYDARLRLRNPRRLWTRSCAKCDKEMLTTFAPGMKETVYCEECYRAAVY
jgi:CxxC-x17-CxxC domain-containing protein